MRPRFIITLLLGAGFVCQAAPVVKPGWDWSLPPGTQPAPYSGFVTWNGKRFDNAITVDGIHIKWAELNPGPGEYNWQRLRDRIAQSRENGMKVGIHLMGVERPVVPQWVMDRFHPPVMDVPPLQEGQPWHLQIVPPWIPEVDNAFHDFLKAFGRTGIAQSDDIVYAYVHGISPSRGEELFLRKQDVEILERVSGLTPEKFGGWLRRRIDAMLVAFKGAEHKLAWMSGGPVGPTDAYRNATADIWKYALDHGTGIRGGGIDFMNGLINQPAWASTWTEDGHCVINDADPTIAQRRYRGDENEEYGKGWVWRFGPVEEHEFRHRICSLRALQMRQNFQMVSPATLQLNPEINEYVRLTQGRIRDDSPDAWAYLREANVARSGRLAPFKNIERWLIQRDVPGSRSVPALKVEHHGIGNNVQKIETEFDGRCTDRANGQDGLAFQLDKIFWPKPAKATIKVTFTDLAPAGWRLVTINAKGEIIKSAVVENTGDGQRKTATFEVSELAAKETFPGNMDLRLVTEGPGDLTVTMVRVIKLPAAP